MSVGSDPDGGYLVPVEIEQRDRASGSPRSRRSARSPGVRDDLRQRLQEAVHDHRPRGRLGRRDRRAAADRLAGARPSSRSRRWSSTPCRRRPRRCSRTPPSTSTSGSPSEVEQAFAVQEGTAFVTGDGTNKPKGFLAYTNGRQRLLDVGQHRLHRDRRGGRVPGEQSLRRAGRSDLCAEGRLPAERRTS